jgi:phenylacetate-coenzyme A ligase PaaK-like adenylate-forming protein
VKLTPLDLWIHEAIFPMPSREINARQAGLTRQAIDAWQLQKLNETLALARGKSSFYRKHFQGLPVSIGSMDELRQFPFTTPEDVRANPLRFVCVSQDEIQRVVTLQSSGTTGEPKRIYFTAGDQELTIDFFGVGMSTFTEPGDRVLILLPGETPGSVGDLLRLGLGRQGREAIPYGPVRDSLHALEVLNDKRASCLVGSPTQVLGLARRWQPGMHKPRSVLLSTDYLPTAIAKTLEQTWDCQVYNHYGATEMGLGGGVECEAQRGYHLREMDLLFEVVNPVTGDTVPDGRHGEVVFTTLTRRGMPLIRYRMGDRSRFTPGDCPCGTALKTLESVSGRFAGFVPIGNDVLRLPDLDEALFSIPGMLNFSITITDILDKETLAIEAQMLTDTNSTHLIEQALKSIPAVKDLEVAIHCHHNPKEAGSLLKRVILDKRGQHA